MGGDQISAALAWGLTHITERGVCRPGEGQGRGWPSLSRTIWPPLRDGVGPSSDEVKARPSQGHPEDRTEERAIQGTINGMLICGAVYRFKVTLSA